MFNKRKKLQSVKRKKRNVKREKRVERRVFVDFIFAYDL